MTTRPELRRDTGALVTSLVAVAIFAVMAAIFLGAPLGSNAGFPATQDVANESLGDAAVAENASIQETENGTFAVVATDGGNESTQLSADTDVNASIVTAGGQTYGVVSEPVSITATIGYAMFGLGDAAPGGIDAENFLAVFEMIDLVLVAALVGAIMLARREDPTDVVALFASDADDTAGGAVAADGGGADAAEAASGNETPTDGPTDGSDGGDA